MASLKHETRRKLPDYFHGQPDLRIEWRLESWEVGYRCEVLGRWTWETLEAYRISQALKDQAVAAASKLIRESAKRWNERVNAALAKERELNVLALSVGGAPIRHDGRPEAHCLCSACFAQRASLDR